MGQWRLSRVYSSSAGTVAWDSFGDGVLGDVVFLHGTPFSSYVWRDIARALAPHFRVFVWDMPGYGASVKYDGQDVSLAAQGQVLAELLEHWQLDRPSVVAHDFGGAVGLRAHLLHGAAYRRLALVDPVALAPWGSPFFRLVGEHTDVFRQIPPSMHAAMVREYVKSASNHELPESVLDQLVAPWLGDTGQAAFYRQIAQANQRYTDEIQDRYRELQLPVLVCWGAADTWISVEKGKELNQLIPGSTLRIIADTGHLVQEDAPAELTAALYAFLRDD